MDPTFGIRFNVIPIEAIALEVKYINTILAIVTYLQTTFWVMDSLGILPLVRFFFCVIPVYEVMYRHDSRYGQFTYKVLGKRQSVDPIFSTVLRHTIFRRHVLTRPVFVIVTFHLLK